MQRDAVSIHQPSQSSQKYIYSSARLDLTGFAPDSSHALSMPKQSEMRGSPFSQIIFVILILSFPVLLCVGLGAFPIPGPAIVVVVVVCAALLGCSGIYGNPPAPPIPNPVCLPKKSTKYKTLSHPPQSLASASGNAL